jgi:class 3 adenylate cyclase
MASKTVHRRLAAILAADVVGYSRLMNIDEVRTLQALKAHRRELIDPAIAARHGRIVKTTGDGALVEFASVVDAVGCAVVIQRGMLSRNVSLAEDRRIVFRIGINVGDIIIDGDDIFGDGGAGLAARIAASHGVSVCGIDAAAELLAIGATTFIVKDPDGSLLFFA